MAVATALPSPNADGAAIATPSRTGKYLEAYVNPITGKEMFSAAEGSYSMATTPTPGTGIIGAASMTALVATTPIFCLVNGSTTRTCYPQFLNLHETVVSTAGARVQFSFFTDNVNRYTSGGTALTISSCQSGLTDASGVAIHVGAVTAAAASSALQTDHVVFRGTIDVVEDQYEFIFGGLGAGNSASSRVTTVSDFSKTCPPYAILPGHSLLIYQWAASQANAPTYEYRFGFISR
jgi:hypothetical protein